MHPTTIAVVTLSILAAGALAATDWYIWGIAQRPHFHGPRLVRPLSVRELAAMLLNGICKSYFGK